MNSRERKAAKQAALDERKQRLATCPLNEEGQDIMLEGLAIARRQLTSYWDSMEPAERKAFSDWITEIGTEVMAKAVPVIMLGGGTDAAEQIVKSVAQTSPFIGRALAVILTGASNSEGAK